MTGVLQQFLSITKLRVALRRFRRHSRDGWRRAIVSFRNWLRRLRRAQLDYVVVRLSGPLPERSGPPRSFLQRRLPIPPPPLSMQQMNAVFQRISDAENVGGAMLVLEGLEGPGLATLQNLRRSILRLRDAGKEVVVFTPYLNLPYYYVACAADRVVVPPGARFEVLGLNAEALFLRDALDRLGIEAEILQVSPYKTAGNIIDKSEMTPEQREQMNWLLDDNYDNIIAGLATGRDMSQDEMKKLIDQAPFSVDKAREYGLVDAIAYEDELAYVLAKGEAVAEENGRANFESDPENPADKSRSDVEEGRRPKAQLMPWTKARPLLLEKARRTTSDYIGVISLEGTIAMGPNRQPPVNLPVPIIGGAIAGEATLSQLLRRAERRRDMAALIFHIDSRGGLALASDLIWRQLKRVALNKPVLVYMGNVAASGGYYVAAAADHIMSQAGTLTGSIGVISGRFNTDGIFRQLNITRTNLQRGKHAALYSDIGPITEEERELLWDGVMHSYQRFKQIAAEGRALTADGLERVAGGRVWTGRHALAHKLVDSHGDFIDAIQYAKEMAELPVEDEFSIPVVDLFPSSGAYLLPQPYEPTREILAMLAGEQLRAFSGQPLLLMPYEIKFW